MTLLSRVAFMICLTVVTATLRAADDKPVSFHNDIRPVFNSSCNACHKPEKLKGELDMTTHAMLMKGGKHGATVVAGDPTKSKLVEMISGDTLGDRFRWRLTPPTWSSQK